MMRGSQERMPRSAWGLRGVSAGQQGRQRCQHVAMASTDAATKQSLTAKAEATAELLQSKQMEVQLTKKTKQAKRRASLEPEVL